ncbi:dihydrofolate reductase family protein [Micromonospora sp. DT201]|uniref:dihydrofolate reductase family protein n=1 Tax=Micromonospora sp. DT201 TaxID=3393442 RepID=UPI003CE6792A
MRKIVMHMSVSLDGFFEGPDGDLGWHQVDDELHWHFNEEIAPMGGFLNGRVTYELMAAFWPTADQDPTASGPMREYARIWRDMPKIVYSRTLDHADWNATVVREVDVEQVRKLTAEAGGDLALGGANLAVSFAEHDLIDEYRTYIHPVLLGRGRRPFPDADGLPDLRLVESREFSNGVVLLRNERVRKA